MKESIGWWVFEFWCRVNFFFAS